MRTRRRKISIAALAIKLALSLPATSLLAAGCASSSVVAPFPARPDTVVPGDLRGPFDGRVLDAESGKPVEGAAIAANWAFEEGRGLAGPAAAVSRVVETDADGRFRLPRLTSPDDPRQRLVRFTLIVYKRGWIAWRSDRRFADLSPRHDFAQGGTVIKIEKLPAEISHARHLAFVGAGGPLLSRLAWELPLAAQETMEAGAPVTGSGPAEAAPSHEAPPLDAKILLSPDELKAVTGFKGEFTVESLADLPTTENYDSVHFVAKGRSEREDAAFRVFKLPPGDAEKQYEVMLKELPEAKEMSGAAVQVGDRSLRSTEGEVLAVGTLVRAEGVVLLFTCGKGLCPDHATMVGIVKRMVPRMARLGRAPVTGEGPKSPHPAVREAQPATTQTTTDKEAEPAGSPDLRDERLQLKPPSLRPGRPQPAPEGPTP